MKLYHYATWRGETINKCNYIKPGTRYGRFFDMPLVFLTTNEFWEPSIQSYSLERYHEQCGSCPQVYTELGIPCWKFEVRVPWQGLFPFYAFTIPHWKAMIHDAIQLGSDVTEWYVTRKQTTVIKSWRWKERWE